MIKVHCFVSCVCEVIKRSEADHRPYYFGVWDADFSVTDRYELSYHSDAIDHSFFRTWYEMLYNIQLVRWYKEDVSKEENIATLTSLLEHKPSDRHVMVMLDLSMLPERENKFHQRPFPHYVMLETTESADEWLMLDPDFRWEGRLPKERIIAAIKEPSVAGGYYFDSDTLRIPTNETVEAYFHTCLKHDTHPMTEAVRSIVHAYAEGAEKENRQHLTEALKQIPVMAIRKYAYEHAFAYFYEALGLPEDDFEAWCDEIEKLVKGYTAIQYRAIKYAMTGSSAHLQAIYDMIDQQLALETEIKSGLHEWFSLWKQSNTAVAGGVL